MANNMSIFGFVIVALMLHGASAVTYTVLDNSGWIIPGNDSVYRTWSASKNFKIGDTLVFNYQTGTHDVAEVSKADYDACNGKTPIRLEMNSPVSLNLTNGEHYYICTFVGHCLGGQKLAVTVGNTNGSPTPAPSSPPSSTPSPTNTPPQAPSPNMPSPPAPTPPQAPSPSMPSPSPTPSPNSPPPTPSPNSPPTTTPSPDSPPTTTPSPDSPPTTPSPDSPPTTPSPDSPPPTTPSPDSPPPTTPSPDSPPTPPSTDSPPPTPSSGPSSIAARGFFVALLAIVIAFLY